MESRLGLSPGRALFAGSLVSFLLLALGNSAVHEVCRCSHAVSRCGFVCAAKSQLGTWAWQEGNATAGEGGGEARPDASASHSLFSRRPAGVRYTEVRAYFLVASWVPERRANVEEIVARLTAEGVNCTQVVALRGDDLTPAAIEELEARGLVTRREAGGPTRRLPVPSLLRPLFPEHLPNQMNASHNWRWNRALGNTEGAMRCLKLMAADAAAADAAVAQGLPVAPSAQTLYVYMEDDAVVADPFRERVLEVAHRLPAQWDMLLLSPPPHMCERSRWLPPPFRVLPDEVMAPKYAYSRSTGVVHSAPGVQQLLSQLPASNIIDMWYRSLMRSGRLSVRIHCGDIVAWGAMASKQAR